MSRLKAVAVFQGPGGLPRNEFESGFHFQTASGAVAQGTLAEYQTAAARVVDFYVESAGGAVEPIAGYMSPQCAGNALIKVYDYFGGGLGKDGEAITGPPAAVFSWATTIPTDSVALPSEVALCLSYYGVSNTPRHRGRVYVGPFQVSANGPGAAGLPAPNVISALVDAGTRLIVASGAGVNMGTLTPVSPATAIGAAVAGVDWNLRSNVGTGTKTAPAPVWEVVTAGWCDNEWDTQRRRRIEATARQTFP